MHSNQQDPAVQNETETSLETSSQPSSIGRHLPAFLILVLASAFVSMLVTPADPFSFLLATVPIFLVALGGYLAGVRKGNRP